MHLFALKLQALINLFINRSTLNRGAIDPRWQYWSRIKSLTLFWIIPAFHPKPVPLPVGDGSPLYTNSSHWCCPCRMRSCKFVLQSCVANKDVIRKPFVSYLSNALPMKYFVPTFQHIDVDLSRLTKLLSEAIAKFRLLKKGAQLALMNSLEKAIWNWMDNYRKSLTSLTTIKETLSLGRR